MKKRIPFIKIETKEDVELNWNKEKNCLELLNSKGKVSNKHLVSIGNAYLRESKSPKVLRLASNPTGGTISFQHNSIVYDRYMAIDTSYKIFGNNYLCATSSLCIDQHLNHEKGIRKGEEITIYSAPRLVFLAKPGSKPERYGWMRHIDALLRYERFNADWSYGIVIDSDLDKIQKINAGEYPIIDDFFIPGNITLIYASADAGKEVLINKLIRATDRVAQKTLNAALGQYSDMNSFTFEKEFWDIATMNDFQKVTL